MKLYTFKITEKNTEIFKNLPSLINKVITPIITEWSQKIAEDIRKRYFTSSFGMYSPDSDLYRTIKPEVVISTKDSVVGGVNIGDRKTSIFVAPVGQPVYIRPRKAKALAIPTSKAAYDMQKGVGSLRDLHFLKRGKGGLYHESQNRETDKPMFVLRKAAQKIVPKVHPDEIAAEYTVPVVVALRNAIFNALKGV